MKQLPGSKPDFITIRDKDKYFVDKSMLIGQMLERDDNGVFLFTRPRRFGKSLNLSMIDAFFNLEYRGNQWFNGLEVSRHPEYDSYRNAFSVVHMDMSTGNVSSLTKFLELFNDRLFGVFRGFTYLKQSSRLDEEKRALFGELYSRHLTETDSQRALSNLCAMLEIHHGTKVVVLIDEYDNAVNSISDPEVRREVLDFLKIMFSSLLKGNDSLQMAVITGIMQIAKENIFSGLNNLHVNNVFSSMSDEMFGFTASEVRQICADYGHPEKFEEAREWYDGYRFGNADIYNPWSIIGYVGYGFVPVEYWANTSANSIINDLLEQAGDAALDNLRILGSGGSISKVVKTTVAFDDLVRDPNMVYSMMAVSGYLKAVPDGNGGHLLSIPNRELFSVFASEIVLHACGTTDAYLHLKGFCSSLISGDVKGASDHIHNLLKDAVSSRFLNDEHSYQAFIAGVLMVLAARFDVKTDYEAGDGYFDIRLQRIRGSGCNVVIELKKSTSEGSMQADAENALEQIKAKNYAHGLKGCIVLYGIAFFGKRPCILSERI